MQVKFRSEKEFSKWYNQNRHRVDVTEANKNLVGGGVTVNYLNKGTAGRTPRAKPKHLVVELKGYRSGD